MCAFYHPATRHFDLCFFCNFFTYWSNMCLHFMKFYVYSQSPIKAYGCIRDLLYLFFAESACMLDTTAIQIPAKAGICIASHHGVGSSPQTTA